VQHASPAGTSCTATAYLLPAVCGGVGQLIVVRKQVLLSLSWVLRSLLLCVAVMALFVGTEKTLVTVNLGSLYRCRCR